MRRMTISTHYFEFVDHLALIACLLFYEKWVHSKKVSK